MSGTPIRIARKTLRDYGALTFAEHRGLPAPVFLDVYKDEAGEPSGDRLVPCPGKVLVYGDPGARKTWWVLHKVIELAALGHRTVYCAAEDYPAEMEERLVGLSRGRGLELAALDGLVLYGGVWLDGDEGGPFLDAIVADKVRVVVIDPLVYFYGGSENRAEEVRRFLSVINKKLVANGLTVILVHHSNKPSSERRQSARGSNAWSAWADIEVMFGELDEWSTGLLVRKRRGYGERHALKFHIASDPGYLMHQLTFEPMSDEERVRLETPSAPRKAARPPKVAQWRRRAIDALALANGRLTKSALRAAIRCGGRDFDAYMRRLFADRVVRFEGDDVVLEQPNLVQSAQTP